MNAFSGTIGEIRSQDRMSMVTVQVGEAAVTAVVLETPDTADYLHAGQAVEVLFKETEVVLALPEAQGLVALENAWPGTVTALQSGTLLCEVAVATPLGSIVAIITLREAEILSLAVDTPVCVMVKTNEIMLAP